MRVTLSRPHTRSTSRRYRTSVALTAALGLAVAACGSGADDASPTTAAPVATAAPTTTPATTTTVPEPRPVIVATTTIWADVANQITCDGLAEVATLIPPGGDSHAYEPSLRDREIMGSADLLIANGLDLEEGLLSTIEAVTAEGVALFSVADAIPDVLENKDDDDDHDHGHSHGHGHSHSNDDHDDDEHGHSHAIDPHIWFDPLRVADALDEMAAAITAATGLDPAAIAECTAAYQAELRTAHDAMDAEFARIPAGGRLLVSSHSSLGYLADRFGFTIVGTALPGGSSMSEANPADLEALAQKIRTTGVPALFAEEESSRRDLDALARRVGDVEVVDLRTESLDRPGQPAGTYLGFLTVTAETIAAALSR